MDVGPQLPGVTGIGPAGVLPDDGGGRIAGTDDVFNGTLWDDSAATLINFPTLSPAAQPGADFVGGLANHGRMSEEARRKGIGGAAVGIAVGVLGAAAAQRRAARS